MESSNFRKLSIFLASSGSFNVKNDNIDTSFSLFSLQILNLPALLQNKNTRIGPSLWKWSVLQNPDQEKEPIRAQGFALDWVCHIMIKHIP